MAYDKAPRIMVSPDAARCRRGWPEIVAALPGAPLLCVECYPGSPMADVAAALRAARPDALVIETERLFRSPAAIEADLAPLLTDDPVFGQLSAVDIDTFLDPDRVADARAQLARAAEAIVVGVGAAAVVPDADYMVLATMARWELQQRQRAGWIGNLGCDNQAARPAEKYKRAFFVDWRVGDRIKLRLAERADAVLDLNGDVPQLIAAADWRKGLAIAAAGPFRVVPFFDPGPWGGQWMKRQFDLPDGPPNYAWCFDCVPEENSLLLGFGERTFELPALDVVLFQSEPLLGRQVVERFGAEFPIRFDFLDTMEGGNLSLQVHPLADYAQDAFGLTYTQDESYYLLDAAPDGIVYLGVRDDTDAGQMAAALAEAQAGGAPFPAERFVNAWPAHKHDHFLIPAGTVHGAGRGSMVLEISATPYIFTFKLWDWGRLGLDGRPRPIHLDHGLANIQWDRDTDFTRRELINRFEPIGETADWRLERTGLHALQFIETERLWFRAEAPLETHGSVNVLNLVEGAAAWVKSPAGCFAPFLVHYAETFIVPAAVGRYTVEPATAAAGQWHAVVRARVRVAG